MDVFNRIFLMSFFLICFVFHGIYSAMACDPEHDWISKETLKNRTVSRECLSDTFFNIADIISRNFPSRTGEILLLSIQVNDEAGDLIRNTMIRDEELEHFFISEARCSGLEIATGGVGLEIARKTGVEPARLVVPGLAGDEFRKRGISALLQITLVSGTAESLISVDSRKGNESLFFVETSDRIRARFKLTEAASGEILWIDEINGEADSKTIYKMLDASRNLAMKVAENRFTVHKSWSSAWSRPDDRALLKTMEKTTPDSEEMNDGRTR